MQELLTIPEHLRSYPVFISGVRVTRSLVLCVCFVYRFLSFFVWPLCYLSFFNLRIPITAWVLQALLKLSKINLAAISIIMRIEKN